MRIVPALLLSTLLFTGCAQTPPASHPAAKATPRAAGQSSPESLLAGRWHNNDFARAGATKQFTPDKANPRHGQADGFWGTGGSYTIKSSDAARRSLEIAVKSNDDPAQSFTATLVFTADGKHFTLTKISGQGGPSAGLTFYRTR